MKETEKSNLMETEGLIRIDRMYESLRYNDYSMEHGLGEIVDNSVEAGAGRIGVFLQSEKQRDGKRGRPKTAISKIVVVDDGYGMSQMELGKCLVLGESMHPLKEGKRGIGRFGVGMTLGSISLARRVEVYSRTTVDGPFFFTYIDLDEIHDGVLIRVPAPVEHQPSQEYESFLQNSSGTVVVMCKCDRINEYGVGKGPDSTETWSGLANYLGRTYRKFIAGGLTITLNGSRVYLHDPLYLAGPTKFDVVEKGTTDAKAKLWSESKIELPVTGREGETACVSIKLSLLPKEWRLTKGAGGSNEAKKRKIDQNEGVSILRANREVLYGRVPFITGKRGEAATRDYDRWWGCEISFPPELDDYFQIRYIKRGAEPVPKLLDMIRGEIQETVNTLRKIIQTDWQKKIFERKAEEGAYDGAVKAMARAERILPRSKRGVNVSERESRRMIDDIVNSQSEPGKSEEELEREKAKLRKKPYIIDPVNYPVNDLFEVDYAQKQTIIHINVNHAFYKKVLLPLCGPIEEDEDIGLSNEKRRIKDAIMLLILSYARAEAMFDDLETKSQFTNLRNQWGTFLSTALECYETEEP